MPSKKEGLTLFILSKKIEKGYINEDFTDHDLELAINEASDFFLSESIPHTQRFVDNLLNYHLESSLNDYNSYSLSSYAYDFLELLGKKLFKEHIHFPLRQTFQNYSLAKVEEITSLLELQEWYQNGFHKTSRESIKDHLDYLEDLVKKSVLELNRITLQEENNTVKILNEFVKIFKNVASKSEEISEILRLSSTLKIEIGKVINLFASRKDNFPHPKTAEQKENFKALAYEYEVAIDIENRVSEFFDMVDKKLKRIKDRSLYASVQLDYYKENFRNHSQFRINLKRFLTHTIKSVTSDKHGLMALDASFPVKSIPFEHFKFINLKYYDSFIKPKNFVVAPVIDKKHQESQFQKTYKLLYKQETIAKLTNHYKELLNRQKTLNFTPFFYDILDEERDEEIALTVCFELLKYANQNKNCKLEIDRAISSLSSNKNIKLWNIQIQKK